MDRGAITGQERAWRNSSGYVVAQAVSRRRAALLRVEPAFRRSASCVGRRACWRIENSMHWVPALAFAETDAGFALTTRYEIGDLAALLLESVQTLVSPPFFVRDLSFDWPWFSFECNCFRICPIDASVAIDNYRCRTSSMRCHTPSTLLRDYVASLMRVTGALLFSNAADQGSCAACQGRKFMDVHLRRPTRRKFRAGLCVCHSFATIYRATQDAIGLLWQRAHDAHAIRPVLHPV